MELSIGERIACLKTILDRMRILLKKYHNDMSQTSKEPLDNDLLDCIHDIYRYYINKYKKYFEDINSTEYQLKEALRNNDNTYSMLAATEIYEILCKMIYHNEE